MQIPVIGITCDVKPSSPNDTRWQSYNCGTGYAAKVVQAGGIPILLTHEVSAIQGYLNLCQGFILTGGVDPDVRSFGDTLHPKARVMSPQRQAFELAMLNAIHEAARPTLGVCLGMQMMALHAGGQLDQYMPDTLGEEAAKIHQNCREHGIQIQADDARIGQADSDEQIVSSHQQAVKDPGSMRVIAVAADGTVEAIDDPNRDTFYAGVQWHPERGGDGPMSFGVIEKLVQACVTYNALDHP